MNFRFVYDTDFFRPIVQRGQLRRALYLCLTVPSRRPVRQTHAFVIRNLIGRRRLFSETRVTQDLHLYVVLVALSILSNIIYLLSWASLYIVFHQRLFVCTRSIIYTISLGIVGRRAVCYLQCCTSRRHNAAGTASWPDFVSVYIFLRSLNADGHSRSFARPLIHTSLVDDG